MARKRGSVRRGFSRWLPTPSCFLLALSCQGASSEQNNAPPDDAGEPEPNPAEPEPAEPEPNPAEPEPAETSSSEPEANPAEPDPEGSRPGEPQPSPGEPQPSPGEPNPAEPSAAEPEPTPPPVPGGAGIASEYVGDEGIEDDARVLFADDFERYTEPEELWERWDSVYQEELVTFSRDAEHVYAGEQALEFTIPQMEDELSDALDKVLTQEQDVLYLRYYTRFNPPFDVVGSTHNGASISAHYFIDGQATPGVPADGRNKFLVALEHWRGYPDTPSPGDLNVYVYHPEQRSQWGDHWFPSGTVLPYSAEPYSFGDAFVPREDLSAELDRWYCYEYMVKANTPGQRDGQVTVWVDGVLVADFPALRFRDVAELRIDRFGINLHIGSNPNGEAKKWYDNIVAATSYIGPLTK